MGSHTFATRDQDLVVRTTSLINFNCQNFGSRLDRHVQAINWQLEGFHQKTTKKNRLALTPTFGKIVGINFLKRGENKKAGVRKNVE